MDHEIQLAPFFLKRIEHRINRGRIRHVTMSGNKRIKLIRERFDPLLQGIALIGECQFGARLFTGLGNTPCNGPIVGNAHDQATFAFHYLRLIRHRIPLNIPCEWLAYCLRSSLEIFWTRHAVRF